MVRPETFQRRKRESNPGSSALESDALTTRPTKGSDSAAVTSDRAEIDVAFSLIID